MVFTMFLLSPVFFWGVILLLQSHLELHIIISSSYRCSLEVTLSEAHILCEQFGNFKNVFCFCFVLSRWAWYLVCPLQWIFWIHWHHQWIIAAPIQLDSNLRTVTSCVCVKQISLCKCRKKLSLLYDSLSSCMHTSVWHSDVGLVSALPHEDRCHLVVSFPGPVSMQSVLQCRGGRVFCCRTRKQGRLQGFGGGCLKTCLLTSLQPR